MGLERKQRRNLRKDRIGEKRIREKLKSEETVLVKTEKNIISAIQEKSISN